MTTEAARPRHRVMMLTDSLDVGGLERVVVMLGTELAARGHQVTVVAEPGGALWDDLPVDVRREPAPMQRTLVERARYVRWLARRIRSGEFDVVHAHQRGVALVARLARVGTAVRVVEHVHNVFAPDRTRWLSFRGDRLIACGEAIGEMLVEDFHRPPARITAIPNAVADLGATEDLTLPSTSGVPPTLLTIARTSPQKDPERFIDLIAELNAHGTRVHGVWVGDGDLLQHCRDEVARRGVAGLSFVGAHADVLPFLRQADVVLLTSRWEGLPLVLLEAASMGRPLVAPRVGSCAEVVEHGTNGMLFDVDAEPSEIAALVEKILDPGELTRMGAASRDKYLRGFTVDGYVDRVEEVYRRALAD